MAKAKFLTYTGLTICICGYRLVGMSEIKHSSPYASSEKVLEVLGEQPVESKGRRAEPESVGTSSCPCGGCWLCCPDGMNPRVRHLDPVVAHGAEGCPTPTGTG